ncbi:MAG: hypothetical protein K2K36_06035 [Muribaculaceae bacterium]|nr:hypothetical protein [Muribaculaceae bacterium]
MKLSVIIRFAVIGLLWLGVCVLYVVRQRAAGADLNLLTLFPLIASGVIVFVPLYKKYVRNDGQSGRKR